MGNIETILLTGATGYLGSNLAEAFIKQGYKVIILKRQSSEVKRIEHLMASIKSYNLDGISLETVFEDNKIDYIVHTAASYGRKGESLSNIYNSNFFFPVLLLENAIKYGVENFINTDTALPATLNTYAFSKKQFADLLQLNKASVNTLNIELEYFYGPGDDISKFVTFIIKKMLDSSPSIELSEGTQLRDFIYIKDVVKAYTVLLKACRHLTGFNTVSLGSGKVLPLRTIIEKIKQLTNNTSISLNFGSIPMREGEVILSQADTTFLQNLGWKPDYGLEEGLIETITKEKLAYDNH